MADAQEVLQDLIWNTVHVTAAVDLSTELDESVFDEEYISFDDVLCCREFCELLFKRNPRCIENPSKPLDPVDFASLPQNIRADIIWHRLFLAQSPFNDVTRKLLTSLGLAGCTPRSRGLDSYREYFKSKPAGEFYRNIIAAANLRQVAVKRCIFSENKNPVASDLGGAEVLATLSMDALSADWSSACARLKELGLPVKKSLDKTSCAAMLDFFGDKIATARARMVSIYIDEADFTDKKGYVSRIIGKCLMPLCQRLKLPLLIKLSGACSLEGFAGIYAEFRDVRLFLSAASRNLMQQILELSRRIELCRIHPFVGGELSLEQRADFYSVALESVGHEFSPMASNSEHILLLAGAWAHARWKLGKVLIGKYADLSRTGWLISDEDVSRDLYHLLGGNLQLPETQIVEPQQESQPYNEIDEPSEEQAEGELQEAAYSEDLSPPQEL